MSPPGPRISPAKFDEVAADLGRTLAFVKTPKGQNAEVLAALAAYEGEAITGYAAATTSE